MSDGKQRRNNFYSFIAECVEGIRLTTLAETLEYVENKRHLNPDYVLGTFVDRPANSEEKAIQKLKVIIRVAKILREESVP